MVGVSYRWQADLAETNAYFAKAVALGIDMSPLMAAIGGTLAATTEEAFETESDPEGGAWRALSDERILQRQKKGKDAHPILQDDGILAASVIPSHGPTFVELGSAMEYAATHQFGRGGIPARPYLGIGLEAEAEIVLAVRTFFAP